MRALVLNEIQIVNGGDNNFEPIHKLDFSDNLITEEKMRSLISTELESISGGSTTNDAYMSSVGYWACTSALICSGICAINYDVIISTATFQTLTLAIPLAAVGMGFLAGAIVGDVIYNLKNYS